MNWNKRYAMEIMPRCNGKADCPTCKVLKSIISEHPEDKNLRHDLNQAILVHQQASKFQTDRE